MRSILRILSLAVLLTTLIWWAAAGANRGWTKNSVEVPLLDEITGIAYVEYEDRFVPGVDFAAAGTGIAALLGALSFLFRRERAQGR